MIVGHDVEAVVGPFGAGAPGVIARTIHRPAGLNRTGDAAFNPEVIEVGRERMRRRNTPELTGRNCGREVKILVVVGVKIGLKRQAFELAGANRGPRPLPRCRQGRQQHGGEDGNDCNYHQKLNQCESFPHFPEHFTPPF
ncbi:hypothetical protein SDC9_84589 [bioreactor metagenome]|uniref:Uncharacterized protein n=1 Tax=bioreactor metagenome TaxID=1076179 RepID=A0A644ZBA6_9ZZZZ